MNRRQAIRKKCLDCSANSYVEVTNCGFTDCPLYPFRSGQGKQNAKKRDQSIRKYCLECMDNQKGEVWNCHIEDCTLWTFRKTRKELPSNTQFLQKTLNIEVTLEA